MMRHSLVSALALILATSAAPPAASAMVKWPPWLSIESPVNPYDATAGGAVLLVHTFLREGTGSLSDVTGSAEGVVNGTRRSIALRFERTAQPGIFALRRQWPSDGAWILRIVFHGTTALVALDSSGAVASARVPMRTTNGDRVPRAVSSADIDSTLARVAQQ